MNTKENSMQIFKSWTLLKILGEYSQNCKYNSHTPHSCNIFYTRVNARDPKIETQDCTTLIIGYKWFKL